MADGFPSRSFASSATPLTLPTLPATISCRQVVAVGECADRRRFTINNRVTTWRRVVDWSVGSVGEWSNRKGGIGWTGLEGGGGAPLNRQRNLQKFPSFTRVPVDGSPPPSQP